MKKKKFRAPTPQKSKEVLPDLDLTELGERNRRGESYVVAIYPPAIELAIKSTAKQQPPPEDQ